MAFSQNGWYAGQDVSRVSLPVPGTNVPLTVHSGSAGLILIWFAENFNRLVEPISNAAGHTDDGGFNYRPIAGSVQLSNHSSATAIDLNWNKHPLGAVGTFTSAQVAAIHSILSRSHGSLRWGGDYTGRKDEMHAEINTSQAGCDVAWQQIQQDEQPHPKGIINMSYDVIPNRFAYDEQGNLIDETAVVTLVGEWSQVSSSVPSLGPASGTVGCHWGEPLRDADRELVVKVEFAFRDSAGRDQFLPKIVKLSHFHQFDWTKLPAGAFAFSAGFVKSDRNDLNLPVSVSLTYGSK